MRDAPGAPRALMLAALLLNLIGFANYAAVLPELRDTTGFTEVQCGVAGGAFFLAYALGSPIFAGLTDTRDARQIYLLGAGLGVAGGLLFPWLDDGYPALLASRTITGLGMAGTYMPGLRLLMENLPPDHQQKAAGDYVSAVTLGLSASFAVSGGLQWLFGWPAAFLGAAATAATAALLVRATMPPAVVVPQSGSLLGRLRRAARGGDARLVLLAVFGNSWEGMAFRTWWVALLGFAVALPDNASYAGVNFAIATALVGPLAMPISAFVARRAERRQRHLVIAAAAGSSVLVGAVLAAGLADWPMPLLFGLSVLYVCAIFSDTGSLTPAMLARVPTAERGAALALVSAAGNLAAFSSTIVFGLVLRAAGGADAADAWRLAILVLTLGSAMTAGAMLLLHCRARATRGGISP